MNNNARILMLNIAILCLIVIYGLVWSVGTSPTTTTAFDRDWTSPQGTVVEYPTDTPGFATNAGCYKCTPVGTVVEYPTDTPDFGRD